jgi:hypothetical protein
MWDALNIRLFAKRRTYVAEREPKHEEVSSANARSYDPNPVEELKSKLLPKPRDDLRGEPVTLSRKDPSPGAFARFRRNAAQRYVLRGDLAIDERLGLIVRRIELEATYGVTTALATEALTDLMPHVTQELRTQKAWAQIREELGWPATVGIDPRSIPEPVPRGVRGRGDEVYRDIALRYLRFQSQGIGRGILLAIADEVGLTREQVRDRLRAATERGYLSPGTQGKAGRRPGPRLKGDDNG